MEDSLYAEILLYKCKGIHPETYPITKGNFIALCDKFVVENQQLKRQGKPVLQKSQLEGKNQNTRQNKN